jgi:hypothetical protein
MAWLESALAVLAWLIHLLRPAPRIVTEETYAAKKAEAKNLAKPDSGWDDTVDRL